MSKVRVLCVERLGAGGKKDVEILQKLPGVQTVINADFHYRVGSAEKNSAYLESIPQNQKTYYTANGVNPMHFIDKSLDELVNSYLDQCDAVYIPGSSFDPSTEHCVDSPENASKDTRREDFELKLIQKARERGMPVLAICAGSWRLANAFGGKTEALSAEAKAMHDQWDKIREMSETVTIEKGTMLHGTHTAAQKNKSINVVNGKAEKDLVAAIIKHTDFNETELNVNSSHWRVSKAPETQKDTEFGQQFETSAIDKRTDTVEAFESKHGVPIIGVQFHPEYSIPALIKADKSVEIQEDYKTHKSIIDNWISAGQTYRNKQEMHEELKNKFKDFKQKVRGVECQSKQEMEHESNSSLENNSVPNL